jgi:predicted porin
VRDDLLVEILMNKHGRSRFVLCSLGLVCSFGAYADGPSFYALVDGGFASSSISGPGKPNPSSKTEFVTGGYAPTFAGLKYEIPAEGGIVAGIQLEQGFLLEPNPNDGSHYAFGTNEGLLNRQANIYVKTDYGNVVLGTQPNLAFQTVLLGDARFGSNYGSSLAMIDIAGGVPTVDIASLRYTSPSLAGFTLAAQYVPESQSAIGDISHGIRASVNYKMDDFTAALAYYDSSIIGVSQASYGTILSANYKFQPFTLKGIYANQKTAEYWSSSLTTAGVGGAIPVGAKATVDVGYYRSQSDVGSLKTNTYAAGIQYKLTKNLSAYGQVARVDNSSGTAAAPFNFTWVTVFTDSLTAGQSATTVNIGLLFSI